MKAYFREVQLSPEHQVTARLTLMNTGVQPCHLAGAAKVVLDSGLGPDPAIDGTAQVSEGYRPDEVIQPGNAFAMPVEWAARGACGGNHQVPIVSIHVTLPGDTSVLTIPIASLNRSARDYCWIDGVSLGG